MARTVAEKIFSSKAHREVRSGDIVMAEVDVVMMNDASGPLAIDYFGRMGARSVARPDSAVAIIDHYVPCPNSKVAGLQQMLYDFCRRFGIRLVEAGGGIAHQVVDELGLIAPGRLLVGCDSHSTTYGYLGSLGIGIGASDLASCLVDGELWFKVPETIRVDLNGSLRIGVTGKDVALYLLRMIGGNGANYRSIEFHGKGISSLSMDDRKTICNLSAESCAKCAVMDVDERAIEYMKLRGIDTSNIVHGDEDASYIERIEIDLSSVPPMISLPSTADNAVPAENCLGMEIGMALIGTCTNGRISDFELVDRVLRESDRKFAVETLVIPSSREVYLEMTRRGYVQTLLERGAMILPPGCGPCCGSSPGTPRDGVRVLSSANRNFIGRMGNAKSEIYLASPVTVAASALEGKVVLWEVQDA
ncbi:MAG: 3-isopropylmalate dehydratase large subunit [Spirochaetales bacterium]|nr:3-isopropylmalate dehydratase large subunit [Spirochaetales bacterium]